MKWFAAGVAATLGALVGLVLWDDRREYRAVRKRRAQAGWGP
jgi:hypothetical protein